MVADPKPGFLQTRDSRKPETRVWKKGAGFAFPNWYLLPTPPWTLVPLVPVRSLFITTTTNMELYTGSTFYSWGCVYNFFLCHMHCPHCNRTKNFLILACMIVQANRFANNQSNGERRFSISTSESLNQFWQNLIWNLLYSPKFPMYSLLE